MADTKLIAQRLVSGELAADQVDWDAMSHIERSEIFCHVYDLNRQGRRKPQRRARALLKSWLTPEQLAAYHRNHCFLITGSAGGTYRIQPDYLRPSVRVERHGKRWFAREWFCYHDADADLPPADVALSHMLMLLTDEPGFLAVANHHDCSDQMWNRDYLRRMREGRRQRERAIQEVAA